jgi:hypothetical protein
VEKQALVHVLRCPFNVMKIDVIGGVCVVLLHCCVGVLFWDITWRRVVIVYQHFGTTYQSHLQGSRV